LLTPLGEQFSAADLIDRLRCYVLVVARNELGVINHVRLTLKGLRECKCKGVKVVMMGSAKPDLSVATNIRVIRDLTPPTISLELPFLGARIELPRQIKRKCKNVKKTLAAIADFDTFRPLFKKRVTSKTE
jgi:dethiobiotin synthetase